MAARKYLVPLSAAAVLAVADQASKAWIVARFAPSEARPLLPGHVHLVHVRNRGVAFGFLGQLDPAWVHPLLLGATLLAVAAVLWFIHHHPERGPAPWGLGLVLGGAVGNLADRARLGYVVDFLDLHWRGHHWPAFNVADIGITVGVGLLVLDILAGSREEEHAPRPR